jgi:hypothetical protein
MRQLVLVSLAGIAIGVVFAPVARAAPVSPATISDVATASSPVVKTYWRGRHWGWRRGWRRCNRWRCW